MICRPVRVAPLRFDMLRRAALVAVLAVALVPALAPVAAFAGPRSVSLAGVSPRLAAKARQLERVCGARVISAVRRTRVAGTRRMSLHASGRAVDLRGAPRCLYAHLRGWPGGVSTDYGRVAHVHVSLGGAEQGRRFAHRHVQSRSHRHRRARMAGL